jgi:hypothetical protein
MVTTLKRVKVTPCSIPNEQHSLVTVRNGLVLLIAGNADRNFGRQSDLWKLSQPCKGWNTDLDLADKEAMPRLGHSPIWEHLHTSSIEDKDIPSRLSIVLLRNNASYNVLKGDENYHPVNNEAMQNMPSQYETET